MPFRVHIATVGGEAYHRDQRQLFLDLAEKSTHEYYLAEGDPAAADAILFVDLHQHPQDPFVRGLRNHPLVRAYHSKVAVYDERDYPLFTFPGIYVGGSAAMARRLPILGGPYASMRTEPGSSLEEPPDLLYSFCGGNNNALRRRLLSLRHPRGVVQDTTHLNFHTDSAQDPAVIHEAKLAYVRLIHRSKFVLCPRGHGPSSFRLYETLLAGRVPVVLSDRWLIPPGEGWRQAIVVVPERHLSRIGSYLERREPEWPELAAAGRRLVAAHLREDRLWGYFGDSLATLRHAKRRSHARTSLWWGDPRIARAGVRLLRARRAAWLAR